MRRLKGRDWDFEQHTWPKWDDWDGADWGHSSKRKQKIRLSGNEKEFLSLTWNWAILRQFRNEERFYIARKRENFEHEWNVTTSSTTEWLVWFSLTENDINSAYPSFTLACYSTGQVFYCISRKWKFIHATPTRTKYPHRYQFLT